MHILADGGAPVILAILVGLVGLAAAVAQLVLARRLTLVPLIVAAWVTAVLLGALGVAWSGYEAGRAVAMVDPAEKAVFIARGVSGMLSSGQVVAIVTIVQVLAGAAAITVRGLVAPEGGAR